MPQTTRAQCPGCAASVADDGFSDTIVCAYCGTRVAIHRPHAPQRRAEPPAPPRNPLEVERDALLARLAAEERDWQGRIRAAGRPSTADFVMPLGGAAAVGFVMFILGAVLNAEGVDPNTPWGPVYGCSFYLLIGCTALAIHRLRRRERHARELEVAGHRDLALAPLRQRIAEVEARLRPPPPLLTEKQRRIQTLQHEREEVRRQIDAVYHRAEEARTSDSDVVRIPVIGCLLMLLCFAIFLAVILNMDEERTPLWVPFAPLVGLVVVVIGTGAVWIWRRARRARLVEKLTEERDAAAPKLQRRLHEVEAELERLARR